jgi:D-arginine dehydrogenase
VLRRDPFGAVSDQLTFDIIIIGAGIAGASLAYRLAPHRHLLLLEAESQPGYHSTGRSAAMFMESYGPPQARALTRASRAFFEQPPAGFSDQPLVAPRGVLYLARDGEAAQLDDMLRNLRATGSEVELIGAAEVLRRVPVIRAEGLIGAIAETGAMDIDVHALHQGFLRGAKRAGAALWCDAELVTARRASVVTGGAGSGWQVLLRDGRSVHAGLIVNAAGAWADSVARRCGAAARGLQPKRRSAFTFDAPSDVDAHHLQDWPTVGTLGDGWYFKPDAGRLLGSPGNADAVEAHDVHPKEMDIATGIAGIAAATTMQIRRPARTWAGLRTFALDGELVIGFDPDAEGFFWLAGQGGYGIQSAPAASLLAAGLLLETQLDMPLDTTLSSAGVQPALMAPGRLQRIS